MWKHLHSLWLILIFWGFPFYFSLMCVFECCITWKPRLMAAQTNAVHVCVSLSLWLQHKWWVFLLVWRYWWDTNISKILINRNSLATCVLTYMHNTCLYLCVYFTPTSLFKNAELLSQALGWFMLYIRRSVLRATNSLTFITVVLYYFLRVIY